MSLFSKRFILTDWSGNRHSLTAKKIYTRVMKDSQSDYDWIAPATELIKVCTQPEFPKKYAIEIEIAILNCFANLETQREIESYHRSTDPDAVNFCYNSLANVTLRANLIRHKYLLAFLEGITKYHHFDFNHYGPTFYKICEEWKENKYEEYHKYRSLDLSKLWKALDKEFDLIIKTAEKEGIFKDEDDKHVSQMRMYWSSLNI